MLVMGGSNSCPFSIMSVQTLRWQAERIGQRGWLVGSRVQPILSTQMYSKEQSASQSSFLKADSGTLGSSRLRCGMFGQVRQVPKASEASQ